MPSLPPSFRENQEFSFRFYFKLSYVKICTTPALYFYCCYIDIYYYFSFKLMSVKSYRLNLLFVNIYILNIQIFIPLPLTFLPFPFTFRFKHILHQNLSLPSIYTRRFLPMFPDCPLAVKGR